MNTTLLALSLGILVSACSATSNDVRPAPETPRPPEPVRTGFFALSANDLDGKPRTMSDYAGKVVLVVNTASQCGYTPQYAGLQKLHEEFSSKGLVVLGIPSNDFGKQEPGDATAIKTFCTENYHVTFPMLSKAVTKAGPDQSPVYAFLGHETGKLPNWNFCKYLVAKDGRVLGFYTSKTTPESAELRQAIEAALAQG